MNIEITDKGRALLATPSGWQLVPATPTPKMIDATFNDAVETNGAYESHNTRNERIYAAMLEAAPEPPK